jgi:signal transduction histidine kinase
MIVINDILDFSKLEQDKMTLEKIPFSLYSIVEESLEVVAFESEKKNLELICDMDPNLHDNVTGDAGNDNHLLLYSDQFYLARLRQILINLLSNAVKFSSNGEVILSVTGRKIEDRYEILFSVADQGIGIPEYAKDQLFEPFHQVDNSYSRKYGGSGLGLSISKRLAESMVS